LTTILIVVNNYISSIGITLLIYKISSNFYLYITLLINKLLDKYIFIIYIVINKFIN